MILGTGLTGVGRQAKPSFDQIITVTGRISAEQLGLTLIHEHLLVDFIGADKISSDRWSRAEVTKEVLPFLIEAKAAGVRTMFDCTPAFLGRDCALLLQICEESGIQIVTNTGYYGAVQNKYLPHWAFAETADQLATRWVNEFEDGIDGTNVRPGFIKISVDSSDPLSDIHQKLVRAAARTHLRTGLTICSHTGPALAAFQEMEIVQSEGVHPSAFVWVHAQAEKEKSFHAKAATLGAWISLDGIGWGDFDNYAESILKLKSQKLLHRVLISHDAGWYRPKETNAGFVGYTNIFNELWPRLQENGFTKTDWQQLLILNPAKAFALNIRRL